MENKDYEYWKDFRQSLTGIKEDKVVEKNPESIYKMAKEIGVKPTARYFNMEPSSVRYYIKKIESESANN